MKLYRGYKALLAVAAVLALTGATATGTVAQQQGTIVGTVTDQAGQPVSGAQVFVVGTQRGTISGRDGTYRIGGVPAGEQQVRAQLIGFAVAEHTVTVPAGATVALPITLAESAVALDEIVVTATGEQRRRELANAVSDIRASEVVETAPITTVSQLITGRAAGVNILQSSGTVGTGTRIRIRGANSVSLSNEPVVFVDGVRVYTAADALSVGTGGQTTSRINDLNPDEIESIEIVKGPSAATLYGTDAANGVIVITTKRGSAGPAIWNAYAEGGVLDDNNDYPNNWRGRSGDANCFAFQVSAESCTQDELIAFSPLNDAALTPISSGSQQKYGLNVRGGGDRLSYFLSGEFEDQVGTLKLPGQAEADLLEAGFDIPDHQRRPNAMERLSFRANLGSQLTDDLNVQVSSGYVNSDTNFPQNDNNALGVLPSAFLGSWDREANDGWGFLRPEEVFAIETRQEVDRFTSSAQLGWQPNRWQFLTGRATVGFDLTSRFDSRFTPVGQVPFGSSIRGNRSANRIFREAYTADAGLTASFNVNPQLTSRTSVGTQYYRDLFRGTFSFGEDLPPGVKSVGAAAEQTVSESTTESITGGAFVEQQLGWLDRLFVTGAVRFDGNSAFGQGFGIATYPKVGVSWVAIEEGESPFAPLASLRLRAAWGASGVAPGSRDAARFFSPVIATLAGGDAPAVTFGELGNPNLEPEKSEELELGLDTEFIDGRVGLELTYYNKRTEDALINRRLSPSLGVARDRFENIGSVRNKGFEAALNARLVQTRSFGWDLGITGSTNENTLLELGEGIEPILFGSQRHVEGYPLGGYWDEPVTFEDANDDGIITRDEVVIGDTAVFIGSSMPRHEFAINTGINVLDRVRLSGLLNWRGGFYQENFTEEFRCRFAICRGLNDPDAPLWEQARAINTVFFGARRSTEPYIEDASFWRLQELSLSFFAPEQWGRWVGASRMNLVLTGRNLATWTDYTGLDPELNQVGGANFSQREFLTQPPIRTWVARINLTF